MADKTPLFFMGMLPTMISVKFPFISQRPWQQSFVVKHSSKFRMLLYAQLQSFFPSCYVTKTGLECFQSSEFRSGTHLRFELSMSIFVIDLEQWRNQEWGWGVRTEGVDPMECLETAILAALVRLDVHWC